jgi:hypothetical protein
MQGRSRCARRQPVELALPGSMQGMQRRSRPSFDCGRRWRPFRARWPSRRRPRSGSGSGARSDRRAHADDAEPFDVGPAEAERPACEGEVWPRALDERVREGLRRSFRRRSGRGRSQQGGGGSCQRQDRSRRAHPGIIRHGARTGSQQDVGACSRPRAPCGRRFQSRSSLPGCPGVAFDGTAPAAW